MATESTERWTILKLLDWTTDYFKKSGSDSPRLDAELLLAEARGSERIDLYTAFDQEPDETVRAAFRELVRRRGEGTPVAYLLGHKEFFSTSFRVTEDTLIPRPETEHLVIEVLDEVKRRGQEDGALTILDVGTGSGVIAVCLAKKLKMASVLAVDVSSAALEIARFNANAQDVSNRVEFIESDLLANVPENREFDFICSNPPYVSASEYAELDASVKDFEPQTALLAGETGCEVIERLISESVANLKTHGRLVVELSPMICDSIVEHLSGLAEYGDIRVIRDLAGHKRIVSAEKTS